MKRPQQGVIDELVAVLQPWRQSQGLLLFLDYDGTLVEIAPRPELARPDPELLQVLARVAALPESAVLVVSGRPLAELQELLPIRGLDFLGCHGGEGLLGGKPWSLPGAATGSQELAKLRKRLEALLAGLTGWWLEVKPLGVALHYRQAGPEQERVIATTLEPWLEQVVQAGPYRVQVLRGKKVVEILPQEVSKGAAVAEILGTPGFSGRFPIYIGDNATDESAFQILKGKGLTIKVGREGGATAAAYTLTQPAEVRQLLAMLAA